MWIASAVLAQVRGAGAGEGAVNRQLAYLKCLKCALSVSFTIVLLMLVTLGFLWSFTASSSPAAPAFGARRPTSFFAHALFVSVAFTGAGVKPGDYCRGLPDQYARRGRGRVL